jgi:uncharacterized protein (DUF924 family)
MPLSVSTPDDPRCRDLLEFWFGIRVDDADVIADRSALWFGGDAELDATIRARFGRLRETAIAGQLDDWLARPRGLLALVILVDQFSRNLFRGDPRAFEHDALARTWCEQGLRDGVDRALRPIERLFLYLPLEHSESLQDQQRSVALFAALRDAAPATLRESFGDFFGYAERHRDVIARFGRFPHRNAALGRVSTAQEIAFLRQPGSSF